MKKTKYISFAYLLFISCALLITFIDAGAHENKKKTENNKLELSSEHLNDFKIIVAAKKTRFSIKKDTVNLLNEFFYIPKDTINRGLSKFEKKVVYRINGDTLFIDKTYAKSVTLKAKNLEQIIAKENSRVNISKYKTKTLTINSLKGNIQGNNNNIQYLNIIAVNHSYIDFYNSTIDTVSLYSKNSKIHNYSNKIKKLNVTMTDSSYIRFSKILKINVDSDKSSKYDIW